MEAGIKDILIGINLTYSQIFSLEMIYSILVFLQSNRPILLYRKTQFNF